MPHMQGIHVTKFAIGFGPALVKFVEIFPIVCCKQAACIQQLVKAFSQSVHVARCSLILGQNKCFEHFSHIFLNSLSKGVGRHHPWGPQLGHA
eukprot:scaffold71298_cov14-Tisochrysis_lutea.AAC.1